MTNLGIAAPTGRATKATDTMGDAACLYLPEKYLQLFKHVLDDNGEVRENYATNWLDPEGHRSAIDLVDIITPTRVEINLLITSISEDLVEHVQVNSYLGTTYSTNFCGKAPSILQIGFTLIDCGGVSASDLGLSAKYRFMWLYHNIFSIRQVALYGIIPHIQVEDTTYSGAFLAVDLTETSAQTEIITGVAKFLIFNRVTVDLKNESGLVLSEVLYDESSYQGAFGSQLEAYDTSIDTDDYMTDNNFSGYTSSPVQLNGSENTPNKYTAPEVLMSYSDAGMVG